MNLIVFAVLSLTTFELNNAVFPTRPDKSQLSFHNLNVKNFKINENETAEIIKERLPRVMEINSYDLVIRPYFPYPGLDSNEKQDFTFDGYVVMRFKITNKTDRFPFYSQYNNISHYCIRDEEGHELTIKELSIDPTSSLGFVQLTKPFEIGKSYNLGLNYTGVIQEEGKCGLFWNRYEKNGETRYLIATQFETLYSREVFPNADDPYFKASINLTLIYPKEANVFSNSYPEKEEEFNDKWKITKFKPTPIMSTYLLAFVIGDFKVAEVKSTRGVPIRAIAIASPGLDKSAQIAAKCLDSMEDMLKIPYNQPKLDNVAIPKLGKLIGGMENWQIITYDDNMLTYEKSKTALEIALFSAIVCHEISHQWFGDLVTNDNWGQAFLHESFASKNIYWSNKSDLDFFETEAILHGRIADKEIVKELILSYHKVGFMSFERYNHSVITETQHFDGVIYAAGGSMLRMIKAVIGNEKFFKAINFYLNGHKFKTATYQDLISAFERAIQNKPLCGSNLSFREMFDDFFLQPSYPIVKAELKGKQFEFNQSASNKNRTLKWSIPMFIQEKGKILEEPQIVWLLKNGSTCSPSFKLNPDKKYDFNRDFISFAKINE